MVSQLQVRASHILIKHHGSRRKASWKDPDGRIISAMTRESTVEQLKALKEKIMLGEEKFEDVAAKHSDCSSAKHGGDLGCFGRGQIQKPFEEATFALKVGDLSEIVDTDSGVHIILRTVDCRGCFNSLRSFRAVLNLIRDPCLSVLAGLHPLCCV